MTIEGRPFFGPDTTYAEQRKKRLQDCVDDYLQDEEVSVLTFYNDLKDCVSDVSEYHKKQVERASGLMKLISPIQFQQEIHIRSDE